MSHRDDGHPVYPSNPGIPPKMGQPTNAQSTPVNVPEFLRPSVTQEAHNIINGDRKEAYGPVTESFQKIADLATRLTGHPLTSIDVCWIMIALKICREQNQHKRDNLVDLCGYADLMNQLMEARTNPGAAIMGAKKVSTFGYE